MCFREKSDFLVYPQLILGALPEITSVAQTRVKVYTHAASPDLFIGISNLEANSQVPPGQSQTRASQASSPGISSLLLFIKYFFCLVLVNKILISLVCQWSFSCPTFHRLLT